VVACSQAAGADAGSSQPNAAACPALAGRASPEATRARGEPVPSTANTATRATSAALTPTTGTHLAWLDVAIAVARAAIVIGISIAAVVLRDSVVNVVTMVRMSPLDNPARRRHCGDAEREQDKSCDQPAANSVNEHRELLCRGQNSAAEPSAAAKDRLGRVCM
jgi:hypothetical protein